MKRKMYGLLVGLLIGVIAWYIWQSNSKVGQNITDSRADANPNPSPSPFVELTIPYLQNYQYETRIDTLTPVATHSAYTSYITSYTSDSFKINGQLTIPKGDMPAGGWPAVIFIHGYIPPKQYQTLGKYVDYVDYLAKNNLVVFKIDLRGHGQSQGEPQGAYYSSDYIKDTLNAHTALENLYLVDKSKIGLWGHSMAGNIVVRALAARPQIKTGVIWAGAVYTYQDMIDYGINDNSYVRQDINYNQPQTREKLFATCGRFAPESEFWQQVSPVNYLKNLPVNLQIHHAVNDAVVSIKYSRNLADKLKDSQTKLELYEYPSGGHNLTGSSFGVAMKRTVEFFHGMFKNE